MIIYLVGTMGTETAYMISATVQLLCFMTNGVLNVHPLLFGCLEEDASSIALWQQAFLDLAYTVDISKYY